MVSAAFHPGRRGDAGRVRVKSARLLRRQGRKERGEIMKHMMKTQPDSTRPAYEFQTEDGAWGSVYLILGVEFILKRHCDEFFSALFNEREAHEATRKDLADARQEVIMLKGQVDAAKADLKKCGVIHNTLQSAFHHGPMTKGFIGAIAKVCDDLCKVLEKGDASKEAPAPPAPPDPEEGYRLLRARTDNQRGEMIEEGDQHKPRRGDWHDTACVGERVYGGNIYRRKIAPPEYACPQCGAKAIVVKAVSRLFLKCSAGVICSAMSGFYVDGEEPHASWIKKTEDETDATSM